MQSLIGSAVMNADIGDGVVAAMIQMLVLAPGIWLSCLVGSAIGVLLVRRRR